MKTVLIVSYRFPPQGSIGAHRIAHFTKHLQEFGWIPCVLTGPERTIRLAVDPSLMGLIPDEVRVTRARYLDVGRPIRVAGKLHLAKLLRAVTPSFPNMDAGWIPFGIREGTRILREEPIDLIFSSAYPMCSNVVALALKRISGLPWVAEYRDEWSQRRVMNWPTSLHRVAARRIDRAITSAADRVITTSPAHTDAFARTFFSGDARRLETVMNGFDEERFPEPNGEPPPHNERMTVSHVGSTFSWRGPGSFLKAVQELIATDMIPSDRISLRFVGSGPTFQIEDSRCSGIVENLGHVAHDAAIAELRAADVLVLFNTEESNILAKTFEYLASGRPILALTPPGPTADLLRDNGVEVILDPEDATGIERALYEFHARWQKGALLSRPTGDLADKYSRRAAARRLGSVFDSLVPRRQT